MKAHEFTAKGIRRARQFLDEVRADPEGGRTPPRDLLEGRDYTRAFRWELTVDRRRQPFASRREIGEYLAPKLKPLGPGIADRTSLWSWLGLFHFEDTVRIVDGAMQLSPLDETFVLDPLDDQNLRGQHRHCLRSAWQLYAVHGDNAAFLLNQHPTARGDIADRIFQSQRIFNSTGIVPLILGLYTNGKHPKRGFRGRPGGLRHLLRVLDQLERTYDVYGMPAHALVRILPPEFQPWTNGASAPANEPEAPRPEKQSKKRPQQRAKKPASARSIDQPPAGQSPSRRSPGARPERSKPRSGAEPSPPMSESRSGPSQPAPKDPKLEQWEADLRRKGQGTMRYKGFQATVSVNTATGTLQGRIMSPSGWWMGRVEAGDAPEFKRALRSEVDEHLARGSR
ncbi:hypothetical protein [Candidatus Palauibacter sp.]|uniref:hypothetical protein n=1 Tax=Candidatus Palauibacter sp. TaxID=3101350 RepID=UPI003AF287D4